MKPIVAVLMFIAVLAIVIITIWSKIATQKSKNADRSPVKVNDISSIVSDLKARGKDGSFVVFMFNTPDNTEQVLPNVQYSLENGRLGFDWVLIAPQNIRDEEKITQWVQNSGYSISRHTMNGVSYLRSETEGVEKLGAKIICDFYKLSDKTELEIITEGF